MQVRSNRKDNSIINVFLIIMTVSIKTHGTPLKKYKDHHKSIAVVRKRTSPLYSGFQQGQNMVYDNAIHHDKEDKEDIFNDYSTHSSVKLNNHDANQNTNKGTHKTASEIIEKNLEPPKSTSDIHVMNPFSFISDTSSIRSSDNENLANTSEVVLHSVFSPSLENAIQTFDPNSQSKGRVARNSYLDYEEEMWEQLCAEDIELSTHLPIIAEEECSDSTKSFISEIEKSSQATTISLPEHDNIVLHSLSQSEHVPRDSDKKTFMTTEFMTPSSRKTGRHSYRSVRDCNPRSIAFLTPKSHITDNHTHASNSNMKMLNFSFVRNTTSIEDLNKVISIIESDIPIKYPSLLRMAKNRLSQLSHSVPREISCDILNREIKANSFKSNDDESREFHNHLHGKLEIASHSTQSFNSAIQSSFVTGRERDDTLSLSSRTTVQPEDLFFEGDIKLQDAIANCREKDSKNMWKNEIDAVSEARFYVSKSVKKILSDRDDVEKKLSSQIMVLSSQLEEITTSFDAQKRNLASKINLLQTSKKNVENDLEVLEDTVADMKKESDVAKEKSMNEQNTLRSRLEELTQQIERERDKSILVKDEIEYQVRCQFEEQIINLSTNIEQLMCEKETLNEKIASKEKQYLELKLSSEKEIANAKIAENELSMMKKKCSECETKIKAMEEVTETLRKALCIAENRLKEEIASKESIEAQYGNLVNENKYLIEENRGLTNEVNHYRQNLEKAREYEEKIRNELEMVIRDNKSTKIEIQQLREERDEIERLYQSQMDQLRAQLAAKDNSISIDLYRKAVNAARKLQEDLRTKNAEIKELQAQFGYKSKNSARKHDKQTLWKSPRKSPKTKISSVHNISIKSTEEKSHRNSYQLSHPTTEAPQNPSFHINSSSRVAAVRAAGGRAGLAAKLKKTRGLHTSQTNYASIENRIASKLQNGDYNAPKTKQISRGSSGKENAFSQ